MILSPDRERLRWATIKKPHLAGECAAERPAFLVDPLPYAGITQVRFQGSFAGP